MSVDNSDINDINWFKQNYTFANNTPIEIYIEGQEITLDISECYEDESTLSHDEFVKLINELKCSKITDKYIKTNNRIIYSLDFCDGLGYMLHDLDPELYFFENEDISIDIIEPDILILLLYIQLLDCRRKYFNSTALPFFVEVTLKNKKLRDEEIRNNLQSYLFEISKMLNLSLCIVEIGTHNNSEYSYDNEFDKRNSYINELTNLQTQRDTLTLDKIIEAGKYNSCMPDFIKCIGIMDLELQYLGFFKILEHCGVVFVQQAFYNQLHDKVICYECDLGHNIESLQEIVNEVKKAQTNCKDTKQLIQKLLLSDEIKIHFSKYKEDLPETLKHLGDKDIIYKLCAFRNKVCHNKANYEDIEQLESYINNNNMEQVNLFMKNLAYNIIHWYNDVYSNIQLKV